MRGPGPGLPDRKDLVARLGSGGLPPGAAAVAAEGFVRAGAAVRASGGADPEAGSAFFVPGRIELFGKHTDYAGGRSLLAAVERGFSVVAAASAREGVIVVDADRDRSVRLPLRADLPSGPGWELYPQTVVRRLARDFPDAGRGAVVAFSSSLPEAAGLASSSALVTALFLGLASGLRLEAHPAYQQVFGHGILLSDHEMRDRLATWLAAVEAGRPFPGLGGGGRLEGVGTEGGSEDHAAVLGARVGRVVGYRFLPTVFEGAWPVPEGWTFAVAASGLRAEKAAGARDAYNRLSEQVRRTGELWREAGEGPEPHLGAVLERGREAWGRLEGLLEEACEAELLARARQFAEECGDLVPAAARALEAGDLFALGRAADRSQVLAEEVLGNQVPETVHLVRSARGLGAPAASAFGAGFGGAVWALVPGGRAERFLGAWRARYAERFPARAGASTFLATGAGPAAFQVA